MRIKQAILFGTVLEQSAAPKSAPEPKEKADEKE